MAEKSRILIIGGTGYIGKFLVESSAKHGHPTFALVRDTVPSEPAKSALLESFKQHGVTLIQGDLNDHEILVKVMKQVDVVISAVGAQIAEQVKIIEAIKEAGNIKRFLPSEFGVDVERALPVEPMASMLKEKIKIRRAIQAEGIPYTFVCSNGFAHYGLHNLVQENATAPPRDKIIILGDGNAKFIFVDEHDVADYTVRTVDDPRTLGKLLHMRPPANIISFNEIVALWESKIGKTLEKIYVPEDVILKRIQDSPFPKNLMLSIAHGILVKGEMTNFELCTPTDVEATELYPDLKFTTVDDILGKLA